VERRKLEHVKERKKKEEKIFFAVNATAR